MLFQERTLNLSEQIQYELYTSAHFQTFRVTSA